MVHTDFTPGGLFVRNVQRSAAERQGQRKSSGCYDSQKTSNHSIENEFPPFILFFIRLEPDPPR